MARLSVVKISGYIFPLEGLEDPLAFVKHAGRLVSRYGSKVLKIKANVCTPEHEVNIVRAVTEKLLIISIRIDPNGTWNPFQALRVFKIP
jgi:L-alanine-DL-glutamate epimerase-like enolase superfamily enzyme